MISNPARICSHSIAYVSKELTSVITPAIDSRAELIDIQTMEKDTH